MKRSLLLSVFLSIMLASSPAFCQKLGGLISVGGQPGNLAINTVTNFIYIPNMTLNTVTVVDGRSNQVVANIAMPSTPIAAAVNSATNLIYVTTGYPSNSVVVIDGSSNTVTTTVAATIVTNLIYFSNLAANLSILDGATNQIVNTITTAYGIGGIAVNQVTNRIYLSESTFRISKWW